MTMNFHRKLPIPQDVKAEFPLTEQMKKVKEKRDESIRQVFEGSSDKFILVIGPCSADHKEPVLEYISRLSRIEEQVSDKFILINQEQPVRDIKACFISRIRKKNRICTKGL